MRMTNLRRNRNVLYLCNQIEENDRLIFDKPKRMKLNYQPLSMTGEIISFGSEFIDKLIIYTTKDVAKQFHNFDRVYINNKVPSVYDKLCKDADFYVNGEPLIYINEATIYLQRMIGDSNEY